MRDHSGRWTPLDSERLDREVSAIQDYCHFTCLIINLYIETIQEEKLSIYMATKDGRISIRLTIELQVIMPSQSYGSHSSWLN